jgi:hypothetical protein
VTRPGRQRPYQLAIDSGDAEMAPKAAVKLGLLRTARGEPAGAAAAFQLAIDSGHAHQGPITAVNLGVLRAGQGDVAGGRGLSVGDPATERRKQCLCRFGTASAHARRPFLNWDGGRSIRHARACRCEDVPSSWLCT